MAVQWTITLGNDPTLTTREVAHVFAVPLKIDRHHKCLPDEASVRWVAMEIVAAVSHSL